MNLAPPDLIPAAGTDEPAAASTADLTTEIRRAARQIELPHVQIVTQPGGTTLVNVETILYTEAETFETAVSLLGYDVDLRARPTQFTWHHGDGTTQTTTEAGQPYPDQTVTHRYRGPHANIELSVDITYAVDYRIDDGAWTTLPETLTATGPTQPLTVRQATPILVRP